MGKTGIGVTFQRTVLVVCHGNINRSPLAAAVLRAELSSDWKVEQGGLKDSIPLRGERAAKKMREAAAALGYDLENHRSRRVLLGDVLAARWIVYMDDRNKRYLDLFEGAQDRLLPLGQFMGVGKIPDPAWLKSNSAEFAEVVNLVVRAAKACAQRIQQGETDDDHSITRHVR